MAVRVRSEAIRRQDNCMFKEGDVYTILKPQFFREGPKGFKYIRLKYWDGHNWIIRFLKDKDTDWIAISEVRLAGLIDNKTVEKARPHDALDAVMIEKKFEERRK